MVSNLSQLGSQYKYQAELDVDNLHESKQEEILMDIFEEEEKVIILK